MSWTDWGRVTDQDGHVITEEMERVGINFHQWVLVLCYPRLVQRLPRAPRPAHIVHLLDAFLPYARSHYLLFATPLDFRLDAAEREVKTIELRRALLDWTTADVPKEVTERTRALLRSEGVALDDNEEELLQSDFPLRLADSLVWPDEGSH